jgi:Mce-associated membrane protein
MTDEDSEAVGPATEAAAETAASEKAGPEKGGPEKGTVSLAKEAGSDATEPAATETEADEQPLLAAKRPPRQVSIRTLGLVLAFAVLLGSTGFLGWQVWQQRQLKSAATDAQNAAVNYAQILTSIDSDKVDENFKQVLDGATGEFKDMYSQSSVELRQLLIENKAAAHGVVLESAVQSISKDKAVVLLFVDQSVTNTKLPDPRIDRSRMKMTLEKVDGSWRASKVELP